jgi:hypothetical protein
MNRLEKLPYPKTKIDTVVFCFVICCFIFQCVHVVFKDRGEGKFFMKEEIISQSGTESSSTVFGSGSIGAAGEAKTFSESI